MKRCFLLGEEKYIDIVIKSLWRENFTINSATWELLDDKGQKVAGNTCEINEHTISCLVAPPKRGVFELIVSYFIAPEKRKVKVIVNVD